MEPDKYANMYAQVADDLAAAEAELARAEAAYVAAQATVGRLRRLAKALMPSGLAGDTQPPVRRMNHETAIEEVMQADGRPLTTGDILAKLRLSGYPLPADRNHALTTLSNTLRAKSAKFRRVGRTVGGHTGRGSYLYALIEPAPLDPAPPAAEA